MAQNCHGIFGGAQKQYFPRKWAIPKGNDQFYKHPFSGAKPLVSMEGKKKQHFWSEKPSDFWGHHLKSGVCGVYEFMILILSHFCWMTTTTTTQTT